MFDLGWESLFEPVAESLFGDELTNAGADALFSSLADEGAGAVVAGFPALADVAGLGSLWENAIGETARQNAELAARPWYAPAQDAALNTWARAQANPVGSGLFALSALAALQRPQPRGTYEGIRPTAGNGWLPAKRYEPLQRESAGPADIAWDYSQPGNRVFFREVNPTLVERKAHGGLAELAEGGTPREQLFPYSIYGEPAGRGYGFGGEERFFTTPTYADLLLAESDESAAPAVASSAAASPGLPPSGLSPTTDASGIPPGPGPSVGPVPTGITSIAGLIGGPIAGLTAAAMGFAANQAHAAEVASMMAEANTVVAADAEAAAATPAGMPASVEGDAGAAGVAASDAGSDAGGVGDAGWARGGLSRLARGPGGGQDDAIPAMLSDGEYVFDADTVAALGDGSNREGARRLDEMRRAIRRHRRSGSTKGIPPRARNPLEYLKEIR